MSLVQIAVIDAGWVIVGECEMGTKVCTLSNASVIRVWGTKKGLGQIALDGPTSETKLDKIGVVFVQVSQIKFLIQCEDKHWKAAL